MKNYSYKEYEKLVIKNLVDSQGFSENDANEYVKEDRAKQVIMNHYENDVEELKTGKITEKVFLNGSVSGTAYCLDMMY